MKKNEVKRQELYINKESGEKITRISKNGDVVKTITENMVDDVKIIDEIDDKGTKKRKTLVYDNNGKLQLMVLNVNDEKIMEEFHKYEILEEKTRVETVETEEIKNDEIKSVTYDKTYTINDGGNTIQVTLSTDKSKEISKLNVGVTNKHQVIKSDINFVENDVNVDYTLYNEDDSFCQYTNTFIPLTSEFKEYDRYHNLLHEEESVLKLWNDSFNPEYKDSDMKDYFYTCSDTNVICKENDIIVGERDGSYEEKPNGDKIFTDIYYEYEE